MSQLNAITNIRNLFKHPEFRLGATHMSAVSPGLAAWGLMTGVAMVNSGMSVWEAVAMSLLVFAGSSQLAAIPLIAAGAPAWVILATSFCVNLRFVVFSAHMRPYMMHMPLFKRLFNGYLTADLSYVLFTKRFDKPATDAACPNGVFSRWHHAQLVQLANGQFDRHCVGTQHSHHLGFGFCRYFGFGGSSQFFGIQHLASRLSSGGWSCRSRSVCFAIQIEYCGGDCRRSGAHHAA